MTCQELAAALQQQEADIASTETTQEVKKTTPRPGSANYRTEANQRVELAPDGYRNNQYRHTPTREYSRISAASGPTNGGCGHGKAQAVAG